MAGRVARAARSALLVLGATLLMLALCELLLRWLAPVHTAGILEAYEYDAELGVRARPGVHLLATTDHQQEIRVNALGTVNFQERFDGYDTLVFALGDSYTQGTGLPADAAYPFQLDLLLNRDARGLYEPRYGVVNLGLAAFGAEQTLLVLHRYAGRLGPPRACLYLGAENDAHDDALFRAGRRHRHLAAGSPRWGALVRPLQWLSRTQLGLRLKLAIAARRAPPTGTPAPAVAAGEPDDRGKRSSVAEAQWPAIERIVAACAGYGATTVVSWASAPSPSYDWLRARVASAARADLRFADWSPAAQSVRAAIPALPAENPHSARHWRVWVNRLIAEAFARELRGGPEARDTAQPPA